MPNPNSGTLDLRGGTPSLVPPLLVGRARSAWPTGPLRKAIREVVTSFLAWRARQQTLRLLHSLDAATLRDLGITDIESTVYGDPRDSVRSYHADW